MDNTLLLETSRTQLRLPTCLRHDRTVAEEAAHANLDDARFRLALAEQEVAQRAQNRQTQLIRAARFPARKELADVDCSCLPPWHKPQVLELARGDYLQKAEPVLMLGNPGLGNTHLATALALAACRQGDTVRFSHAAGLVHALLHAQDEHRLPRLLAAVLTQHLVVIDELGFIPLSPTGAHLLFQLCSSVHEQVAMLVTTHVRVADWTQVFGDERLTAALLDRLTYRAHLLECVGESLRVRQRLRREAHTNTG